MRHAPPHQRKGSSEIMEVFFDPTRQPSGIEGAEKRQKQEKVEVRSERLKEVVLKDL